VSAGVAGATAAALRGHPRPFLAALAAYSLHGLTHLGLSALLRGYTPGIATVPLVVVPYSVWAWSVLRRGGVDAAQVRRSAVTGTALLPPLLVGAHALGRLLGPSGLRRPAPA
jgi:hypothetical protein